MSFDRRVQVDVVRGNSLLALRIEDLKVTFNIQKDAKTSSNIARIEIYNLSADTRHNQFRELTDRIIVRAGYADESLDEVFHGDIVSVSHPETDGNVVTTIEANDGQGALRKSFANVSYAENTPVKRVVQDLALTMGLPIKTEDYLRLMEDQVFLQGFSFAGKSRLGLDKVAMRAGLEWSIQGNQLQILKKGGVVPRNLNEIPLVTPDHGLIGSPERLTRIQAESPDKKPPGWKIKTVLIGRLEPGGQIGLQSRDVKKPTAFRIQAVNHVGDTHGDDWYSLTEALDPGVLISGGK